LAYIHTVLRAGFVIEYNLRKQGRKALATLPFIRQWRFHLKLRSMIERTSPGTNAISAWQPPAGKACLPPINIRLWSIVSYWASLSRLIASSARNWQAF